MWKSIALHTESDRDLYSLAQWWGVFSGGGGGERRQNRTMKGENEEPGNSVSSISIVSKLWKIKV